MSIKRYRFDGVDLVENPDGRWVKHESIEALEADLAAAEDKLAHATRAVAVLRARIPDPDDLRTVLRWLPAKWQMGKDAEAEKRLRATVPTAPELTIGDREWQGRAAAACSTAPEQEGTE